MVSNGKKYTLDNAFQYTLKNGIVVAKGGEWIFINKEHRKEINDLILAACNDKSKQQKRDGKGQLIKEE